MKQKYIKGILGISLIGIIVFSGLILEIIPSNSLPKAIKPFAALLLTADDEYVTESCTVETCGDDADEAYDEEESVNPAPSCTEDIWTCTDWKECTASGIQLRTCEITSECPTANTPSPNNEQTCTYKPTSIQAKPQEKNVRPAPKEVAKREIPTENKITETESEKNTVNLQQEEAAHLAAVTEVINQTPVFQELLGTDITTDSEERTVLPFIGLLKQTVTQENAQQQEDQKHIEALIQKLKKESADEVMIEKAVTHERKKINAQRTQNQLRRVSAETFKVAIRSNTQDSDNDGTSDEVAVLFGIDPRKQRDNEQFSEVEKILFGINETKNSPTTNQNIPTPDANRPITMGVNNGSRLDRKGFTVLASGPRGQEIELVAINRSGKERVLGSEVISENNKALFAVDDTMEPGYHVLQVRRAKRFGSIFKNLGKASILNAHVNPSETGMVAVVEFIEETSITQPVIKNIQDVEISSVRDIKVNVDTTGKVKVTGSADIDALVIGTFQSAVFTSAILADVTTGLFEVNSAQALAVGEHEVTVYATNPRDGSQSKPVRVHFSIIETAQASGEMERSVVATTEALEKNPTVLIIVSSFIGFGLVIVVGLLLHKKKDSVES